MTDSNVDAGETDVVSDVWTSETALSASAVRGGYVGDDVSTWWAIVVVVGCDAWTGVYLLPAD